MAGYKQTVIKDGAAAFWTFDGDMVDSGSRTLLANPLTIIDEIDNQNPAILHIQSASGPHGYRMGMPSMIQLEQTDQASICFGYYGYQPSSPDDGYPKAFLEVPHSSTFQFPHYGSFTIEFMMRKDSESEYAGRFNYNVSFSRPILKKDGVINIDYYLASSWYNTTEYIRFWFPSGQTRNINASGWLNRNVHVVVVWLVEPADQGSYRATEKVFFDSRLVHTASTTYFDTFPSTNIASSWEIGGTISAPTGYLDDRNTSPLYLDQIAVYDVALTLDQVGNHYKKIYQYDDMIVNDRPADYFPMDEDDSLVDWTIHNSAGGGPGEYIGDIHTIRRGLVGPNNIPWSKSPHFSGKSIAYFRKNNPRLDFPVPWFNANGDYSVEFWFNTQSADRGVLLAMQQERPPFQGVQVSINWADGNYKNGAIEFRESENFNIISLDQDEDHRPYRFNDGKWHHIVVQREGTTLRLWIDSILHGKLDNIPSYDVDYSGIMYLLGSKPGDLYVNGYACKFARYGYALQEQQIKARYTYSTIYKIRGQVTLQGVPTKATIRVYKNYTGELIRELESDNETGNYELSLLNNSKIDLLVFNKNDRSVRYRAYGPITPSEYDDIAILV
jgi:hypothetical protein